MSQRQWKRQKRIRKNQARRDRRFERDTFGQVSSSFGGKLVATVCPSCGGRTTEVWALFSGGVGCGRCVDKREAVWLAFAQEEVGEERRTHLVSPSDPITAAS